MAIEIIWQAFNEAATDKAWGQVSVPRLYQQILRDDYRKKVDPRSMLFHRAQQFVLADLGQLLKWGVGNLTLEQYWARAFSLGFEEPPLAGGDLAFDYHLISHYTSLRMVDDYNEVERIFNSLFSLKRNQLRGAERWTFYDLDEIEPLFQSLGEISIQDLVRFLDREGKALGLSIHSLSLLIQNYVEFYRYAKNNHLTPFFFNSAVNPMKWGNLTARQNKRRRRVVELALARRAPAKKEKAPPRRSRSAGPPAVDVRERLRQRRRQEQFLQGLTDTDPLVRQKSVEYLAQPGFEEPLPHLLALLGDQPEIRQEVVRALGEIGSPQAIPPLVSLLKKEEQPAVLKSAAFSLTRWPEEEGLWAMLGLLGDERVDLSPEISFHPQLGSEPRAAAKIVETLRQGSEVARARAAFLAGQLIDEESAAALLEVLPASEEELLLNAAMALAMRQLSQARDLIQEKLKQATEKLDQLVLQDALARLSGNAPA